MTSTMDFDSIAPQEVPVRIKGKDYILKECGAGGSVTYRDAVMKASRLTPDGLGIIPGAGSAETELLLVSLCLYEKVEGKDDKTVGLPFVKGLSLLILNPLYRKAREISGLNDDENTVPLLREKIKYLTERLEALEKAKVDSASGK